jgi:hypothetical protein
MQHLLVRPDRATDDDVDRLDTEACRVFSADLEDLDVFESKLTLHFSEEARTPTAWLDQNRAASRVNNRQRDTGKPSTTAEIRDRGRLTTQPAASQRVEEVAIHELLGAPTGDEIRRPSPPIEKIGVAEESLHGDIVKRHTKLGGARTQPIVLSDSELQRAGHVAH